MYVDLKDLDAVIPKIIFLIMDFRILPGINRIITNTQNLKKNSTSIINIHKEKLNQKQTNYLSKIKTLFLMIV